MKQLFSILLLFSLSIFATACGDEHDHDDHDHEAHGDETIQDEACEHMASGPATAVTAGATEAEATDTSVDDWEHKRVDISLNDNGDGSFSGYVTYEAAEAAEYVFFTSGELTLQINGTDAESTAAVDECSDVLNGLTFDLEVGESILFITATTETVSMVAEEAGEHEDHSDG